VWPADDDSQFVRVDADTRANAGVNIGDVVTVHNATVDDATSVTVQPAQPLPGNEAYEHTVRDRLVDRMVQADERVHVEGLGTFLVRTTTPDGSVRVADDTRLTVLPYGGDESASRTAEPNESRRRGPLARGRRHRRLLRGTSAASTRNWTSSGR